MPTQNMVNSQVVCLLKEVTCVDQPQVFRQVRELLYLLKFRGKMYHPNDCRTSLLLHFFGFRHECLETRIIVGAIDLPLTPVAGQDGCILRVS